MSDTFEHNPSDHEDPLPGPTWIVGVLGAVLLTVIMLGLTALYYNADAREEAEKYVERDNAALLELQAQQHAVLQAGPRLREVSELDAQGNARVVQALSIPIDQAMRLVIEESSSR